MIVDIDLKFYSAPFPPVLTMYDLEFKVTDLEIYVQVFRQSS